MMNGTTMAVGVMTAVSIFMIGYSLFRKGSLPNSKTLKSYFFRNKGNLEEDLKDILAVIPVKEISHIIYSYATCDKQISETIKFINDMKSYISVEVQKLPNIQFFIEILSDSGLDVKFRQDQLLNFWNNLPPYANNNPRGSYGGFTKMIMLIMEKVQTEELHALLRYKWKNSRSFRRFLLLLSCTEFIQFCKAVKKSPELQRLFYWAKEADIEIIFAAELLTSLHTYLIVDLRHSALTRVD